MLIAEQRARDALAFDPLPPSPWVAVEDDAIAIAVRYSEPLSDLLRRLPGAKWIPERRTWRYPFSSRDAIARVLDSINELAAAASARADKETERREAELERARVERDEIRRKQQSGFRPRVMRPEFMRVEGPCFDLALEAIGDDAYRMCRSQGMPAPCWVAQMVGHDGRRWIFAFVPGRKDYLRGNSKGSRGVMVHYDLMSGPIYQIKHMTSWRNEERFFARVEAGILVKMSETEASSCLEN